MPYYQQLRHKSEPEKTRTIQGLLTLKQALAAEIPKKTIAENLLIATWNIREFDSNAYGERLDEAMFYIAEIIDHFDLIAIQEVNENLDGLNRVKRILGSSYQVIFSDVTEGHKGNGERLAFVYDSRKLRFTGLAGEIVIPPIKVGSKTYDPQEQLARTPFVIGLRTSWFSFMISTVHIIYGKGVSDNPQRVKEIELLSDFLAKRSDNPNALTRNLVLLGDFNIFKPSNKTFAEIVKNFHIPDELRDLPSNVAQNKFYDQIAFRGAVPTENISAGIFDFYKHVFQEEAWEAYADDIGKEKLNFNSKGEPRDEKQKQRYFKTFWRTHQMSDHFPMWVELKIDFSESYLNNLITPQ